MPPTTSPQYVECNRGAFWLPEGIYHSLAGVVTNNFVYLREDEDVLTISSTRIPGGRRRVLNGRFRSLMFRNARMLGIVNYRESLRVIAVR